MYTQIERTRYRAQDLVLFGQCPASVLTPRSKEPRPAISPNLFRWQAVKDAILKWHESEAVDPFEDARQFAFGDLPDVQLEVASELLRWYTQIIDRSTPIQESGGPMLATSDDRSTEIASWPTFLVEEDEGTYEILKLRTGSASTTDEYEAAVLATGNLDGIETVDVSSINDVLLVAGETTKADVLPERQQEALAEMFSWIDERDRLGTRQIRADFRPGRHCHTCARVAYCGAYPLLTERKPGERTRVLRISKTNLERLESCERRAAWGAVHQIPGEGSENEPASGTSFGLLAHEALAAVVSSDNPFATFEGIKSRFPASEIADLEVMVEAHVEIENSEHSAPMLYDPEIQIGCTFLVDGWDPGHEDNRSPVAVTFLTRADAIAAQSEHLVVVDHKTSESAPRLEKELLAVSMAARHRRDHGQVDCVEVHQHFLRRPAGERCEITMFERDGLNSAYAVLKKGAERFASFDTYQALEAKPKSVADGECFQCDFRSRCQRWGGPVSA